MDIFELLHRVIGYAIPVAFGVLFFWSMSALVFNREPQAPFWTLLGVLQVIIGVQFVIGGILFLSGARPLTAGPTWLHYIYGAIFPALVLTIAHVWARRAPAGPWLIFGIASFVCAFSTLRALGTGFGWF